MALIPTTYMDSVVAIGTIVDGEHRWLATGFFYGDLVVSQPEERYFLFLVTNRHVLEGLSPISLRFNPQEGDQTIDLEVPLVDKVIFHPNKAVDLAVLPVLAGGLRDKGVRLESFQGNIHAANLTKMSEIGVSEGDGVFVLGFPMGLVGIERNSVIVRSGVIARLQDAYAGHVPYFLIDTSVFPGNSGGPVILKPEMVAIEGTSTNNESLLVGVVQSYIPYTDTAVSQQTGQIRSVFMENSGLAQILPIQFIEETIAHAWQQLPELRKLKEEIALCLTEGCSPDLEST